MSASGIRTEITAALKCDLAAETLRLSGRLGLPATGWSMLPTIRPGDTLIIEPARTDEVSAGDILFFRRHRKLVAHRVIGKTLDRDPKIITQGDGLARPDPPVDESELLGRVTHIVRNGRLIEPEKKPRLAKRAVSLLVRRSASAGRLVAGIHELRRGRISGNHPVLSEAERI